MLDHPQAEDYLRRYEDVSPDILADGTWLLQRRTFWLSLMAGYADPELVGALFDGDDDDADELDELIRQSGRWPVLRLGAGQADFAVVCWHGYDYEGGYDFLVLPDGSGRRISVAAREGHGYGPGLSWPEAERLVSRGRLGTRAQRLLLLLPALGDANTPKEAVGLAAAALLTVGSQACDPAVADEPAPAAARTPCPLDMARRGPGV
ncbi:hypothetical protein [Micromonospora sp. RTP1Z1]|uniref:hypothetical protein n=1 Tax=Micromonospora sp. RTP1Z1 TaxID=2994043 RepID=UPI0029C946D1|nr:hypothetical protein [Micromonospora sp. RTP1Z1]